MNASVSLPLPKRSAPPLRAARVRRESPDALLAKNLVAARAAAGMTQHELAARAGISRATIAQLETGYSDPRLSTVADLAAALGISPILLLVDLAEVRALHALQVGASGDPLRVPTPDLARMLDLVATGMLADRTRAARVGAEVARKLKPGEPSIATAAGMLSALLPGSGTSVGAALAELLSPKP
ncbi:MAG: transcriptional regulator [Bryobacterales bacterium]|nr:transcriptional regulator [Bryobacterales bacterium]